MGYEEKIHQALTPGVPTPIASKTSTDGNWDSGSGNEIAVPTGAEFLHVYVDQDAYLVCSASTDDPAQDGALYSGEQTHVIPCRRCTYLHYKRATASDVKVEATAFGS